MKFIGKILVTALAAIIAANLIPGISINGGLTAIILGFCACFTECFCQADTCHPYYTGNDCLHLVYFYLL